MDNDPETLDQDAEAGDAGFCTDCHEPLDDCTCALEPDMLLPEEEEDI